MLPRKAPKNTSDAAVGGRDHISNLPDVVLQHMLSFLPAQYAVRTCVLAKPWRHLWKSTTSLWFVSGCPDLGSMNDIQAFVDHLLRLRFCEGTPLDTCVFDLGSIVEDDMSRVILWIRIALQCKVRVLQLFCWDYDPDICPRDRHPIFISQYLKKLELIGIYSSMDDRFLELCYCPILEDLKIVRCHLCHDLPISSQSLKRLTIAHCTFVVGEFRMPICVPNLVSLWLHVYNGWSPLLQRMPSLITAYVKIDDLVDCDSAESDDDGYSNQSILLQGLTEVQNLSLIADNYEMFIFRRDLKFCSSFNNLKSLLLDDYWCEPADFSALACLLKLCPVLEKLTLQLYSDSEEGPKYKVEIKLNCNPLDISAEISLHLKIVEVKYQKYEDTINSVLTFLTKQIFQGRQGSA